MCSLWWHAYLDSLLKKSAHPAVLSESSSSEVGSDENYSEDYCAGGTPMDLDTEWEDRSWDEGIGEEPEYTLSFEDDDEFTSSPMGIDCAADPIDVAETPLYVEEYAGAAEVMEERKDIFGQIWETDRYYGSRKIGGPHYPFSGSIEWEVVEWLHSLAVPMDRIDRFFNLEYVR